jgi:hypothetical protein
VQKISQKSIDIVSGICHNGYMENLFANVINQDVIDNLSNEQVDELLEMLKDV